MAMFNRASLQSQQSSAATSRSSTSIAHLEKVANKASQGQSGQRRSLILNGSPVSPRLSESLFRVPVRLPRWMPCLQLCQCVFAAVVLGAGVTGLATGGRPWLQPVLFMLTAIACPTFLAMITSLSALPKIMRWNLDHRLCVVGHGLAMLFWGMIFSASCAVEHAGAGDASFKVPHSQSLMAWIASIIAAGASGIEFLLFFASTLIMIYRYHLALIDYKLCKIEERADSRQQILALDEPLPPPNPAFRTSTGPGPSPQNSGPKVPQRSSLRAIAHFNSQHKQPSLNTKLSQVVKASKSLQEVGLEAASIPLPRSPSPEAKESNEGLSSSQHPNASVDVPVHLAPFHGRLPLRRYSSSDLDQEAQKFSPPDSAGNKALGTSPMLRKPTLMDLALKRSRAPPKKRPDPSAPIALPAQAVPPEAQSEPFSAVLDQTSWPVPPVSISRSASFSSSRQKSELVDSADIGRSLSLTSAHRRGDLIVPLENPRPAPLSPAQKKEDLASRDSGKKKSLQQGKEELVRKKGVTKEPSGQEIATQNSWKRATFHHQEKQDVVRHKNLKRMTHDEDKNMSARLKDLRRESSAKSALKVRTDLITPKSINRESSIRSLREKTDAVKLEGLNREFPTRLTPKESADLMRLRNPKREKSRSPISAGSFAENAKSFSTLAPSFRIGKTRPRPHNLTLKASALDPPDSPPLTSLTHSNWGDSNESKHNIAAPPPSPATLAASIKSNKKRLSLQRQKQRRAARAEAKAAKRAERERASREKVRKETLTPEAERYYTKSPYDFDSSDSPSSSSDDDEESDVSEFALDTNHVPGSASQHRFFANEAGNWSTANHLGDSRAGGGDTPRSMSVYSHQGSQSVYSVDTNGLSNGLPPGLVVHKNGHTGNQGPDGLPRRPMSSLVTSILPPLSSTALMSPGARSVTPLFHRRSTDQLGVNSMPASPADHLAHEYEEEIGELEEEGAELIRLYEQGEEAWVG